jgi:hypothetical protein
MLFVTNTEQILAFVRDVLRMEQAKPWNTAGISGVLVSWKSCVVCISMNMHDCYWWSTNKDNLKTLHKTIKKWQMTLRISLSILRFHNLWFVSTNWLLKAAIPVLFWPLGCRYFPIRTISQRNYGRWKWRLYCNGAFSCFRTQTFNRKQ